MPPKKKSAAPEEKPLLGRFGTSLKLGIVGMPNIGKSSTFRVLTSANCVVENFPFATIDPSDGRVAVPDERFDFLCEHFKPASKIPAYLNVVDIAGLVKGASEGQGLGNAFLSHIRAVDGLFHLVRAFPDGDETVAHVEGDVDPIRDLDIISAELRAKDLEMANKALEAVKHKRRGNDKDKKLKCEEETLEVVVKLLEEEKDIRMSEWGGNETECLNQLQFLTAKPVIYLVNLSPKDYIRKKNKWLMKIHEWVKARDSRDLIIPFSAAYEQEIIDLPEEERDAFTKEKGAPSALPKIITQGFKGLRLQYFFTSGHDEVRAWVIRQGDKAPTAAGKIHGDMERGFIMAEVKSFEAFKEAGSEQAVKAAGKLRQEGKNYVVQDGDIIFFKFNVTAAPKKK